MWLPFSANTIDLIGPDSIVLGVSFQRQNLTEWALADSPADSRTRQLTRGNSTDRQPIFSPDGRWILFSSNRGGNLDLWKLEVETGAIRRITEDSADDWDPAFTRDGRSILWSSNRGGHFEIWMCAVDGTGARQLTQDGVDAENPTATPDGRWIVYNSTNPKQSGIWKVHPNGTGATRIVPGTWSTPDVSPDGRHVVFRTGGEPRALSIAQVEDGRLLGAPIVLPGSIFNGRPRWMPDGRRFLYTASDATGARGIYIQDFVPGQDTTATRRRLSEFVTETPPESFGVAPDGTRLIISTEDKLDSLMLAQGLSGIEPARSKPR
jgi:Tol biopolymer transport system component